MTDECCPTWTRAKQNHTDCEHYGSALRDAGSGRVMICGVAEFVNFCPWCGALKDPDPQPFSDGD